MNPFILTAPARAAHFNARLFCLFVVFFHFAGISAAQILLPFSRSTGYNNEMHSIIKMPFAGNTWEFLSTSDNSTPAARHECSYVEAGGKFHLIGGRGLPAHNVYDPASRKWTTAATIPGNRELHHFQAVNYKGKIYILGAFTGGFPSETPVPDIYIYDPATNTWQVLTSQIPSGRRRGAAGVVVYNNKIYLIGGITNGHTNGWVNWMDEFDPETLNWKILPDAPHPRDHFQAVVMEDKIYIAGGRKSSYPNTLGLTDPTVDVFDFTAMAWSTLPASANLPTPRAGNVSVVLNNELVVIAGESGNNGYHREVEAFNPATKTWRSLPPLNNGRNGPGGLMHNGRIYVVAGVYNGNEVTTQEVFNTDPNPAVLSPVPDMQVIKNSASDQLGLSNYFIDDGPVSSLRFSVTGNSNPGLVQTAIVNTSQLKLTYTPDLTGTALIRVRATDAEGLYAEDEFRIDVSEMPAFSRFINAGGQAVNAEGQTWLSDQNFTGGSAYSTSSSVGGTSNQTIYKTERYGKSFGYSIPVPSGTYNVRLHFAEIYWTATGKRVFNVNIENGQGILSNYDIFQKAGHLKAQIEEFRNILVTDGQLNIQFSTHIDNAKVSGIEIVNTTAAQGCGLPSGLTVSGLHSTGAELNWNPVEGASRYQVEYKKHTDSDWELAAASQSGNSFTLTGLPAGTQIQWRVKAVCGTSSGSYAEAQFTTPIPVADAGQDQSVSAADGSTILNGSGTVTGGSITGFQWAQVSGPTIADFSSYNEEDPVIRSLSAGTYVFSLKVKDNHNAESLPDQVTITVTDRGNTAPTAFAGNDFSIRLPQSSATLNGSGNDDGSIQSYSWSQVSGPGTAVFSSKNVEDPQISGLVEGSYIFSLVVTDDAGASSTPDQVTITVNKEAASFSLNINAGGPSLVFNGETWQADQYFSGGSSYTSGNAISGTTNDAVYQKERFGKTFGYAVPVPNGTYTVRLHFAEIYWTAAGKRVFNVNIENGKAVLNNLDIYARVGKNVALSEEMKNIAVTDGTLNIAFSTVTDNAKVSGIEIRSTGTSISCGSVTGLKAGPPYSTSALVEWSAMQGVTGYQVEYKTSSAVNWIIASSNTPVTNLLLENLQPGTVYNWRVKANCSSGGSDYSAGQFQTPLPVAQAGADQAIVLPQSFTQLRGKGFVDHGTISGYQWTQRSGPNIAVFDNQNIAEPEISQLTAGTYEFSLVVTDQAGTPSLPDEVKVTVTNNQPPSANAGPDKTVTLPVNHVILSGSGTDADGIMAYSWSQSGGPNTAIFNDKNIDQPSVSNLIAGTYSFELVVTDNAGLQSSADRVTVLVQAAPQGQVVSGFTLINAANETDIMHIQHGAVINLAQLPSNSINIRANTSPSTVGRVVFTLSGPQNRNASESVAPYALFGDNNGNYNGWTPAQGNYTLTATPFTSSSGGTAGTALTVSFSVINQSSASRSIQSSDPVVQHTAANRMVNGNSNIKPLRVTVLPNPSTDVFTIQINGNNKLETHLKVMDVSGRVVEVMKLRNGVDRIQIGQRWKEGMYYMQLTQGAETKRIQLLKMR